MNMFASLAPAVKKETRFVTGCVMAGVLVMLVVFFVLHLFMPEKVPFGYQVILGGIAGGIVAALNFFLMGVTVQKITESGNTEDAAKFMKASYSRRMMLQMLWVVVAIIAPCFQPVAGIIPLLFPGAAVKLRGLQKNT